MKTIIKTRRQLAQRFTLTFYWTAALTALCGILMVAIAIWLPDPQTAPIASVFETLKYGFTAGMLTIFGLLKNDRQSDKPGKGGSTK
jgi:zinc transporter ZupT